VPGLEVYFFDVPVEVLDLDELGILIDRQYAKGLLLLQVLVPLADDRLVISAHRGHPHVTACATTSLRVRT
jgi:hypothetical protein